MDFLTMWEVFEDSQLSEVDTTAAAPEDDVWL